MSGMYDRLKFPAQGLLGGGPGAAGSFKLSDGRQANPKELLFHPSTTWVDTALPGGGGYGDPLERDPEAVLLDVLNGYVSIEAAARDYGVVIRSTKRSDEQISLPRHFSVDLAATEQLRTAG
jgi:N-methylhydantoinase B